MGNQTCENSSSVDSNFSSPMPIIGLYVAGVSSVCLLLITLDIIGGFCRRKRWLPCRFFPLNSVTLTLLGIATKLPVDLTTAMPDTQDQLSKITGTTLICISMGFFVPSIGSTTESECTANLASLTIFVITVLVNICIQMRTGVINLFQKEHIIILCCMILLLAILWFEAATFDSDKQSSADHIKEYFTYGEGSLLRRLKVCSLYSYESDHQLRLCRNDICPIACVLCVICTITLVQVIFRSFVSKELVFSEDISDYKWSMWSIIFSQIVTIFIGCLGTAIRFLSLAKYLRSGFLWSGGFHSIKDIFYYIILFPITTIFYLSSCLVLVALWATTFLLIAVLSFVLHPMDFFREEWESNMSKASCFNICNSKDEDEVHGDDEEVVTKEYKRLISDQGLSLDDWILKRSGKDLKRWIKMCTAKAPNHLIELLRQTPPSQEPLTTLLKDQRERCSISIVALERISSIFIPSSRSACIFNSLAEVIEILFYIDERGGYSSLKKKAREAKDLWNREGYKSVFEKVSSRIVLSQIQMNQVTETIQNVKDAFIRNGEFKNLVQEFDVILGFIHQKAYTSMEDLQRGLEQLFVDVLHEHMIQLPGVILKEINESSPEDLKKRLKEALKVVIEIQQLCGLVQWSFPAGTTLTSLATTTPMVGEIEAMQESNGIDISVIDESANELPIAENQSSILLEGDISTGDNTHVLTVEADVVSPIISIITVQDEIVLIE